MGDTEKLQAKNDSKTLWEKIKKDPYVYIGFVGCLGTAGYGIYAYRSSNVPATLFFTRLRVIAQGMFVFTLTGAVGYKLVADHLLPKLLHSNEAKDKSEK